MRTEPKHTTMRFLSVIAVVFTSLVLSIFTAPVDGFSIKVDSSLSMRQAGQQQPHHDSRPQTSNTACMSTVGSNSRMIDIKTIFPNENLHNFIIEWLNTLTNVHRSEPFWITTTDNIMSLSPSSILHKKFQSLYLQTTTKDNNDDITVPKLFESDEQKQLFDTQWRKSFISLIPDVDTILKNNGISNTHPLRLQVIACPKNMTFPLHVHPAIELDIPLFGGTLHERKPFSDITFLPKEILQRNKQQLIGQQQQQDSTLLFTNTPSQEEIKLIGDSISEKVVFNDYGKQGIFIENEIQQGQCLINRIGSVHQTYTNTTNPCLLFVLGPNVHGHFKPGHFHQQQGIETIQW